MTVIEWATLIGAGASILAATTGIGILWLQWRDRRRPDLVIEIVGIRTDERGSTVEMTVRNPHDIGADLLAIVQRRGADLLDPDNPDTPPRDRQPLDATLQRRGAQRRTGLRATAPTTAADAEPMTVRVAAAGKTIHLALVWRWRDRAGTRTQNLRPIAIPNRSA